MVRQRQLVIWLVAAIAASLLLTAILVWRQQSAEAYWSTFLVGDPHEGSHTFREKGCVHCHTVNRPGTEATRDLGFQRAGQSTMNQLVTEMWNHGPDMWKQMEAQNLSYPSFTPRDMANLFAYLYTARYVDEPGDTTRGWVLFSQKGCLRCHAVGGEGGDIGPDIKDLPPVATPILWAQTMWNHAPAMEASMEQFRMEWPKFEGTEMNDLLAFTRQVRAGPQREFDLLPADPRRGWELFKEKSCIACHSVGGEGGTGGPDLSTGQTLAPTLSQVAGQMWNHSPQMWEQMKARGIERPSFEGQEMADLIAFLYSVRYFELAGSEVIGRQIFAERSCSRCHGDEAVGGQHGPRLRGRGRVMTPVTLARAFWLHGPRIYEKTRELNMEWPKLQENDLGHLMVFLNTPPGE